MLEIARVAGPTWRNDLRLILFGGEEEGLFGSLAYVAALPAAERSRIRAVVNMDMIAAVNTPPDGPVEGAAVSQTSSTPSPAAATYTGLAVSSSQSLRQRPRPVHRRRDPAVLTIEGADSANTTSTARTTPWRSSTPASGGDPADERRDGRGGVGPLTRRDVRRSPPRQRTPRTSGTAAAGRGHGGSAAPRLAVRGVARDRRGTGRWETSSVPPARGRPCSRRGTVPRGDEQVLVAA